MVIETYKKVTLKLNSPLITAEEKAINRFADLLRENGGKMEWDDKKINVFLYEIDYHHLQHHAVQINTEHNTDILSTVLGKIDAIKSYGLKDGKRLYVDYNKERETIGRKQKEQQRGRHFYANDNHFSVDNQCLATKHCNKIICADSERFLQTLPDNCVDLIFTSPPYNFGLDYDSGQDAQYWQQYLDKLFAVFDECIRVLKHGGRIIVNVQPLFSDYIPTHHLISNHFINKKLIWRGEILWGKNNYNCKYTAWGSWKSPSNPYLKYTWEFLEIFCKGQLKKKASVKTPTLPMKNLRNGFMPSGLLHRKKG